MDNRVRIGAKITKLRTEKGLTQRDLASLTGLSQSNIWKIETGKYSVSIDILSRICEQLGKKIDIVEKDENE